MSNPELCCNCIHYEISCRDDGILPNDYCGMYESKEAVIKEICRKHREKYGVCNGCEYSTKDHDCSVYELTRGAMDDE